MAEKKTTDERIQRIVIPPPHDQLIQPTLTGTSPLVIGAFGPEAMEKMRREQEMGTQQAGKSRKKPPKDFNALYKDAMYIAEDGWLGLHASAVRNACISASRLVGFKMTLAKLTIFTEPDGFDRFSGKPLVRIYGEPEMFVTDVKNSNGSTDLRARPMWRKWYVTPVIRFNADQFTTEDVVNLLAHAGRSVGFGQGRADSRQSAGMGFGFFDISMEESHGEKKAAGSVKAASARRSGR